MTSALLSTLSRDELLALREQLGTWNAVREHLRFSAQRLKSLRECLGCYKPHTNPDTKKRSTLDPWLEQIRDLAAQGLTCPEIVAALGLPVKEEQVRRFIHLHGIPLLARRGAQPGKKHRDWNGGRVLDKSGYVLLLKPSHPTARKNGYIFEHRWVMEQHIGRLLEPQEVVHHINGHHWDNSIENLELFPDNATHLAATLRGQKPEWTEEGRKRIWGHHRRTRSASDAQTSSLFDNDIDAPIE